MTSIHHWLASFDLGQSSPNSMDERSFTDDDRQFVTHFLCHYFMEQPLSFLALSARTWRETNKHWANYDVELWPCIFCHRIQGFVILIEVATHKTHRLTSTLKIHLMRLKRGKLSQFYYIYYNKVDLCWSRKLWIIVFFSQCSPKPSESLQWFNSLANGWIFT